MGPCPLKFVFDMLKMILLNLFYCVNKSYFLQKVKEIKQNVKDGIKSTRDTNMYIFLIIRREHLLHNFFQK